MAQNQTRITLGTIAIAAAAGLIFAFIGTASVADSGTPMGKLCKDEPIVGTGANRDEAWTDWVDRTWRTYGPLWHNLANSENQEFNCAAGVCTFSARPCKSHSGGGDG
jgi:hypothetical protein